MAHADTIADFALGLKFEDIPAEAERAALIAIADALACGLGAINEPGPAILRDYAERHATSDDATILGASTASQKLDIGLAALVNGALVRDLDANDIFAGPPGRDTGHFSDAIPAVLAATERAGASGAEFLTAVVIAYEVQAALATAYCWMARGLHSVSQLAWAIPAAAGRLLGLTHDEIVSAIGLAGTTGGLMLNSWLKPGASMPLIKGGAPGFIGKQALEATELASLGFTAPADALETLFDRLPADADPSAIEQLGQPGHFASSRNMLKRYPAQIYTQSAIEAAVSLHPRIESTDEVAVATVYGHRGMAAGVQGSGAAYTPLTRAAADHSTPFVVATALRDGDVSPASYDGEPWLAPEMIDLMRRIDLVIDPEFETGLTEHGRFGCRLVVELLDGERVEATVTQQHGHPDNPLSRDELLAKMRGLADRQMGQGAADRLFSAVEDLPSAPNLDRLLDACRTEE